MLKKRTAVHPLLLATFAATAAAGAIAWIITVRTPHTPPADANPTQQRTFWRDRVRQNPADTAAYVRLGENEERAGFYLAARKNLLAARALGAPDAEVCSPLGRTLIGLVRYPEALPELTRAYALSPDSIEAVTNLAGLYVLSSESGKASQVIKQFADSHPDLPPPDLQKLMLAAVESESAATAKALAERLARADTTNPLALVIQARYALSEKRPADAERLLGQAIKFAPSEAALQFLLGLSREKQNKKDEALAAYHEALRFNPNAVDAKEKIARLQASRGNFAEAADIMTGIAQRSASLETASQAAELCRRAKRANDAFYWQAIAYGFAGRFPDALRLARQAAQTSDLGQPAQRTRASGAIAEAYRGMSNRAGYEKALLEWTTAGNLDDWLVRASGYEWLNAYDKEEDALRHVLEKAPERVGWVQYRRSQIAQRRQMREEVARYLEAAVAAEPQNAIYHRELASEYFERQGETDRLKRATEHYEKAIMLSGDEAADFLRLGLCYAAQNRMPLAVRNVERAVEIEPGYGAAYLELSRLYGRIGDKAGSQEMISLYQRYVTSDQERQTLRTRARLPKASAADYTAYADYLVRADSLSKAVSWYERALRKSPKDMQVRAKLKSLYARLRIPDRAAEGLAL